MAAVLLEHRTEDRPLMGVDVIGINLIILVMIGFALAVFMIGHALSGLIRDWRASKSSGEKDE